MNTGRAGAIVGLACTVQFVDVIGVTLLVVALPTVQHDLSLSGSMLSWVAGSYALVFGGLLVPGGWMVDLTGRRSAFLAGSAVVAAGSLVCALAGSGGVLLAGRAIQGAGAAVAVPAALALLLATVPDGPRRARALGLWTMAGAAGGASGFVLGGVVTDYVGWRLLFAAIAVVELCAVALTPLIVRSAGPGSAGPGSADQRPPDHRATDRLRPGPRPLDERALDEHPCDQHEGVRRRHGPRASGSRASGQRASGRGLAGRRSSGADVAGRGAVGGPAGGRLDGGGAALAVVAVVALVWSLNNGLGSPVSWGGLLVAVVAGGAFVVLERRVPVPMVPPWVWRLPSFRLGAGAAAVLTATTSGASVIGSLFLQDELGLSGAAGGASFMVLSVGVVVSSTLAPVVLRRIAPAPAMAIGFVVVAASLALQALSVSRASLAVFLFGLAGVGLGLGLTSVASTAHGTAEATDDTSGLIGGLLTAAAQIGTAVGIALLLAATADHAVAFVLAAATAIVAALGCGLSAIRGGPSFPRRHVRS